MIQLNQEAPYINIKKRDKKAMMTNYKTLM